MTEWTGSPSVGCTYALRLQGVDRDDVDSRVRSSSLLVVGNGPAFKALFGGLVVNDSRITEAALGSRWRAEVDSAAR